MNSSKYVKFNKPDFFFIYKREGSLEGVIKLIIASKLTKLDREQKLQSTKGRMFAITLNYGNECTSAVRH